MRGTIWPANKFGLGLPAEWNQRFYMEGNGGTGGSALLNLMNAPMKKGFATAVTDMGTIKPRNRVHHLATLVPTIRTRRER